MRVTSGGLSHRRETGFLMVTSSVTVTLLLGRISAHLESIVIIAAIVLMSIGIYLMIALFALGKNCPACAVKLRFGTHRCYRCRQISG
jgi:hypothetical protein